MLVFYLDNTDLLLFEYGKSLTKKKKKKKKQQDKNQTTASLH